MTKEEAPRYTLDNYHELALQKAHGMTRRELVTQVHTMLLSRYRHSQDKYFKDWKELNG